MQDVCSCIGSLERQHIIIILWWYDEWTHAVHSWAKRKTYTMSWSFFVNVFLHISFGEYVPYGTALPSTPPAFNQYGLWNLRDIPWTHNDLVATNNICLCWPCTNIYKSSYVLYTHIMQYIYFPKTEATSISPYSILSKGRWSHKCTRQYTFWR